jgi:ferritin-like metal-binding protein YciE
MKQTTLEELFVDALKDLLSAVTQLIKALPKMAKAANSEELRAGFESHWRQTQGHADRLNQILTSMDASPRAKKCKAMEGLIEEGKELMTENADSDVLDAALIAAAQKVEHYEIASYGTVRTWAQLLGNQEAVDLLQQTLDEEKETDDKLSHLALQTVNEEAAQAS